MDVLDCESGDNPVATIRTMTAFDIRPMRHCSPGGYT
jgi:hypothetical protein